VTVQSFNQNRHRSIHLIAIAIAGLFLSLSANIGSGQQLDSSTRVTKAAPPLQSEPQATLVGPPWEYRSAPARLINPLLLTDGTVIFQDNTNPSNWYKLTPDIFGSYVNGTFSQIASLQNGYGPTYFASAVLPDGRVIIEGGEYNGTPCCQNGLQVWTSQGAIYDPLAIMHGPRSLLRADPGGSTPSHRGAATAASEMLQPLCCPAAYSS
jgi:hypothetical protein